MRKLAEELFSRDSGSRRSNYLKRSGIYAGAAVALLFSTGYAKAEKYDRFPGKVVQVTDDEAKQTHVDIKNGMIFGIKETTSGLRCFPRKQGSMDKKYSIPFVIIDGTEYELDVCHCSQIAGSGTELFYDDCTSDRSSTFYYVNLPQKTIQKTSEGDIWFSEPSISNGLILCEAVKLSGGRQGYRIIRTDGTTLREMRREVVAEDLLKGRKRLSTDVSQYQHHDAWNGTVAFMLGYGHEGIIVEDIASGEIKGQFLRLEESDRRNFVKRNEYDSIGELSFEGYIVYFIGDFETGQQHIEAINTKTKKKTSIAVNSGRMEDMNGIMIKRPPESLEYIEISTTNMNPDASERYIAYYSEMKKVRMSKNTKNITSKCTGREIVVHDMKTGKKYPIEIPLKYNYFGETEKIKPKISGSTVVWTENGDVFAASFGDEVKPVTQTRQGSELIK